MADTRTPDVNAMAEAMFLAFHQRADRVRSWATAPVEDIGPESGRMTWTFLASVAAAVPSVEEREEAEARATRAAPQMAARPAPATVTTTPGTATVPPVVHVDPFNMAAPRPVETQEQMQALSVNNPTVVAPVAPPIPNAPLPTPPPVPIPNAPHPPLAPVPIPNDPVAPPAPAPVVVAPPTAAIATEAPAEPPGFDGAAMLAMREARAAAAAGAAERARENAAAAVPIVPPAANVGGTP